MEPSFSSIQSLVGEIKRDLMLSSTLSHFPTTFVSPSAYETAWLAMIPQVDPQSKKGPMFIGCLDWIINNQKEGGFWGEEDQDGFPTIDALPSTLACIVALNMWAVGKPNVTKGLDFISKYSEKILMRAKDLHHQLPRWLTIVLPGTIELAQLSGLKIEYSHVFNELVSELFSHRQQILSMEVLVDKRHNFPLLSYLEALPVSYRLNKQDVLMNLSENGSLFQSPSATTMAYMITGNHQCLKYLECVVKECDNGVPAMYPLDEELIKLYIINQIQRSGLAEHFVEEIDQILETIHKSYNNNEFTGENTDFTPVNIYKDSLAFRILRMHGYDVSPDKFCWFVYNQDILSQVERNYEQYMSVLYNIYRSSDLVFPEEHQLEKAKSYSIGLLKKGVFQINVNDDNLVAFPNLKHVIARELNIPWLARLDHNDHRFWIEDNMVHTLWVGKASYYRLLPLQNKKLTQLAVRNYELRQSIYRRELEELKRWSKDLGLASMGFGREKTIYCYFSIASATSLPHDSIIRTNVAKSAIIVTVADDFFDTEGSLDELKTLTQAIHRWNGNDLTSHSKKIFDVVNHLVTDISTKLEFQSARNAMEKLREMWRVAFATWMKEATWSKTGYVPSMDEYLETGRKSIAIDTMILPSTCFLTPGYPISMLNPVYYEPITKLLMVTTRLLNDVQSYQKEEGEGKKNFVLLYLEENTNASVEDSIAYVKEMMDGMKKDLLKHALLDGAGGSCKIPKTCRLFHLSCLRIFQMFFNSRNLFDTVSDLTHDINRAIYIPLHSKISKGIEEDELNF